MGEQRVNRFRFASIRTAFAVGCFLTLALVAACRHGAPILDMGPRPPRADGTISGNVRGPEGTSPVAGRSVEVVNVETGERQAITTSNTGGFTFKVKPGNYRVELTLLDGEVFVKRPSVIHVNRSDVDAHADFVLGVSRISRPRLPRLRGDDGLGPPIA